MPVTPLNERERERVKSCARGMRQHEFICNMLEHDDIPEPSYGIGPGNRLYKMSAQVSFSQLIDRLQMKGFTLLIRGVPTRNNCGHDRFYSLRRMRDVTTASPIAEDVLVRRIGDDAARADQAEYARARATA